MRSTIDDAGRIVIPKPIRDGVKLAEGQAVEIRERDGRIEIDVLPTTMVLEDSGSGPVAAPEGELSPLTDELVRATGERSRRHRRCTGCHKLHNTGSTGTQGCDLRDTWHLGARTGHRKNRVEFGARHAYIQSSPHARAEH